MQQNIQRRKRNTHIKDILTRTRIAMGNGKGTRCWSVCRGEPDVDSVSQTAIDSACLWSKPDYHILKHYNNNNIKI